MLVIGHAGNPVTVDCPCDTKLSGVRPAIGDTPPFQVVISRGTRASGDLTYG